MTRRRIPRGEGRLFLTSAEVAKLIGYASADTFLSARARLVEDERFPEPIQQRAVCPLRWRRDEIVAWMNRPPARVEGVPGMVAADLAVDRAVMMRMARTA